MDIIALYQPLDTSHILYVCQLHFNPDDLQHGQNKITLRKNANPM